MKKFILVLIFFLFICSTMDAQSKSEKAIAASVEKLRLAMISGNQKDLETVVMDELTYGHSGGHVEGKAEFVEKIARGKSDFVTISLTDQTIQVSKKVGVVRHNLSAETNDNNKPASVHLKILLIFVKDDGEWKLLARQAVKQV